MIPKVKKRLLFLFMTSIMSVFTIALLLFVRDNMKMQQNNEIALVGRQASLITLFLEHENKYTEALQDWENEFDFSFRLLDQKNNILYETKKQNIHNVFDDFLLEFHHTEANVAISNNSYSSQSGTHIFNSADKKEYYGVLCSIYANDSFLILVVIQEKNSVFSDISWVIHYMIIWVLALFLFYLISVLLIRQAMHPTEQAIQSQKNFIAAASHELKTPLAVILSSSDIIKSLPDCTDNIQKYICTIDEEISRMTRLIHNLLILSSVDAGNWTLHETEINIDTFIINIYEKYEPICKRKKINLQIDLPECCFPIITSDEDRLSQIIEIFLDNAITYSPENSTILLKAKMTKGTITIMVEDHGIGINDESKKRVFDRFYQCDQSRTEKNHFGLGLSIAKELAEIMNAHIDLYDTKGGGSTFSIKFMLKDYLSSSPP